MNVYIERKKHSEREKEREASVSPANEKVWQ